MKNEYRQQSFKWEHNQIHKMERIQLLKVTNLKDETTQFRTLRSLYRVRNNSVSITMPIKTQGLKILN